MKVLLAVDDAPDRYENLARRLIKHDVIVAVVQNPIAADILLDSGKVFAAMLDRDMPEWCGEVYAREIFGPRSVPVCVSSANHPAAKEISKILSEFAVDHSIISVTETAVEERWMGWILDKLYAKKD